MDTGWQANHLRVELARSSGPNLRHLPREPRRHGPGTGDVQRHLRRLPDVFTRRQEDRIRIESERESGRRDERVYCGLGSVTLDTSFAVPQRGDAETQSIFL